MVSPAGQADWWRRPLGATGLEVSALGLGAGHIGSPEQDEAAVAELLHTALDAGITLIDTARGYGMSEERLGLHLNARRSGFVLVTKVGYDIEGFSDWTGSIISAGVDAALQRLRTDQLDVVLLHSCPLEVLQQGAVIEALLRSVEAGKIRAAGYSGENEALRWAVESGHFSVIETSVNIADQRDIDELLPLAQERGIGVIAKRPLANAPWRFAERPVGDYAETYWERWRAMNIDPAGMAWDELALRFSASVPGVSTCIAGTSNPAHLRANLAALQAGPLPPELYSQIRSAFKQHDQGWDGQI